MFEGEAGFEKCEDNGGVQAGTSRKRYGATGAGHEDAAHGAGNGGLEAVAELAGAARNVADEDTKAAECLANILSGGARAGGGGLNGDSDATGDSGASHGGATRGEGNGGTEAAPSHGGMDSAGRATRTRPTVLLMEAWRLWPDSRERHARWRMDTRRTRNPCEHSKRRRRVSS